jgi:hypothetical protein
LQTILSEAAAQFSSANIVTDPAKLKLSSDSNLALISSNPMKTAS